MKKTVITCEPIETAPKDGSKILVECQHGLTVARWKPQEQPHHDKEGWFAYHFRIFPTHWAPLPTFKKD